MAASREPNSDGRALAMTVFSPVRPWYRRPPPPAARYHRGVLWLRVLFTIGRALPERSKTIRQLSFIHFARWIVVGRKLPDHGQPAERLKQPLLLFESNYNGSFDQYIDGFANILTGGMTAIWGTSYGFPGPKPVANFKSYIRANEFVANHYYSAYPRATTTMIKSALLVSAELRSLSKRAATLSPPAFAVAYRALLTTSQQDVVADYAKRGIPSTIGAVLRALRSDGSRSGRAYAITLMTPIKPGSEAALVAHLAGLGTGEDSPLARMSHLHFGRWVVIDQLLTGWPGAPDPPPRLKSGYLLFTACVTAPDEADIPAAQRYAERLPGAFFDEIRECIAADADAVWGHCFGYPGADDKATFVNYLARSQIETSLFHVGYPDATRDDVRNALAARARLIDFARLHQGQADAAGLQAADVQESRTW